jgi:hypothetical protein
MENILYSSLRLAMASNGLSVSFLTIKEIRDILRPYPITIPREANSRKELLLEYLRMNASPEIIFILNKAEQEKADASSAGKESRKRKRGEDFYTRRVARRLEEVEAMDVRDINRFMQLPTADQTKALYRKYYLATSNAAIAMAVCGVCAREVDLRADQLTVQRLDSIPNSHRLVPQESHSAHDLFQGKLLEPAGVVGQGDGAQVNVCRQCWASLRDSRENVPEYSLANNMWIGRTPWELQILTFPEQLLVALLYPRVYVFKLHPTCKGNFDNSTLQRGMKGTVTTYELNSDGVSAMVAGDLMPRPPEVLASVISVTYVGLGELPKNWLRNTFRVRREVVRRALGWLKANNPKYYGNIKIDPVRIRALPEDDVPLEITSLVRQSTDTGIIDQESDGYVPEHEESEVGAGKCSGERGILCLFVYFSGSNSSIALSTDTAVSSDGNDLLPLLCLTDFKCRVRSRCNSVACDGHC